MTPDDAFRPPVDPTRHRADLAYFLARHELDLVEADGLWAARDAAGALRAGPCPFVELFWSWCDRETPLDETGLICWNPSVIGGRARIRGRRVTVAQIAGMIAAGDAPEEIAKAYDLSQEEIRAACAFAYDDPAAAQRVGRILDLP